ncbi:hypothetical protein L5515_002581 [Caenorhabditis briggsae]|uniref:Apple domain-containing protein n=1 Tax=Caenorhabditis briggsae TaxID=6238 RepID=A0AAE9J4G5_CAEBR|nr:hypothetical protein L5515_002581 [Caenorhabditis briggsae]
MLLPYLFFFLSPCWAQNLTDMIAQNPLLAKMSMFQEYSENSTIPLPSTPDDQEEEEEDFVRRMSSKRSSTRETVSDNFDERFKQMNASLFDSADPEVEDLDYRTTSDDVDLQKTLESEESSSSSPFSASQSLFDTPIGMSSTLASSTAEVTLPEFSRSSSPSFSSSSPYFKAFPKASTSSFVSSTTNMQSSSSFPILEDVTSSELSEFPESTPIILSQTTSEDEERFFMEPEELVEDNDVEDISTSSGDLTTSKMPTSSFQGTSLVQLQELPDEFIENHQNQRNLEKRKDENEVTQFNGRYSVSATKYYVDNRINGEHYENVVPEQIEDTIQERGAEEVDPFAVEREMRKMTKMHAAKTQILEDEDPLKGLETMMLKDQERRRNDEVPEEEKLSIEIDKNGRKYEARETTYRGKKTTVNLYNKNLYGHDLMRFPGAIFDDRIDEPRRKSDKRRAVASRIVLSDDEFHHINPSSPRLRKVLAGVTTNVKTGKNMFIDQKLQKTTEDVESVCYNTKKNTGITKISPLETDDNLSKLECLTKCARSPTCYAATYSTPLATCAMYGQFQNLASHVFRSQGSSLHRKLSKSTLRCVRMFVSREEFGIEEEEEESAPPFLRLVEKDIISPASPSNTLSSSSTTLLFSQRAKCPTGQDVIFVRSDDVEASNSNSKYVEITEDDCVFACLTNSRPGGGASDCSALEYDKTRGFCYLMGNIPNDDMAMTPRPRNPVNSYEKICIRQSSANKCSGGQPIRHRQKVLIGHLVDAHSVGSAAECLDLCIEKHTIGCVSVMFYAKESTLNCILNDSTNLEDPASFFDENATIVDFFSIQDCLGIREVNRRAKKRKSQNRIEKLARLRRKMARI